MNREQQLEAGIRELVQLSAGVLLQLAARGCNEAEINRAEGWLTGSRLSPILYPQT